MSGRTDSPSEMSQVEQVRGDLERLRREIDATQDELELRLSPPRIGVWLSISTDPEPRNAALELRRLSRHLVTRLRETAWLNPVGLGSAAFALGYMVGRRLR